jgi:SAM-dependent methyltransferase
MPAGSGDAWAEIYERGRPGWPHDVVGVASLPSTATVLDLGAGTGKLTRLLVPAFGRVVAVEPADAMRAILERLCPDAESFAGRGQGIPLADASIDASSPRRPSTGSTTSSRSPRSSASCVRAARSF